MYLKLLDTDTGETSWTDAVEPEDVTSGVWSCDCLRAECFVGVARVKPCCDGGDCRGYQRWLVVELTDFILDHHECPTMHECNAYYPFETLFKNGVDLD
ncbi:MAG: hypothetical protein ACPH5P_00055 [Akkermansiaceae bacterium]